MDNVYGYNKDGYDKNGIDIDGNDKFGNEVLFCKNCLEYKKGDCLGTGDANFCSEYRGTPVEKLIL